MQLAARMYNLAAGRETEDAVRALCRSQGSRARFGGTNSWAGVRPEDYACRAVFRGVENAPRPQGHARP